MLPIASKKLIKKGVYKIVVSQKQRPAAPFFSTKSKLFSISLISQNDKPIDYKILFYRLSPYLFLLLYAIPLIFLLYKCRKNRILKLTDAISATGNAHHTNAMPPIFIRT